MKRVVLGFGALVALAGFALAQHHGHGGQPAASGHAGPPQDAREFVKIPEPMNSHMLANMRDHLVALEEIQTALAKGDFALAASTAEKRLGMSSLEAHGASHVAGFMPKGMQEAGTMMHRSASRFATIATDAGVTGQIAPAITALGEVMRACNACHAGYRTR